MLRDTGHAIDPSGSVNGYQRVRTDEEPDIEDAGDLSDGEVARRMQQNEFKAAGLTEEETQQLISRINYAHESRAARTNMVNAIQDDVLQQSARLICCFTCFSLCEVVASIVVLALTWESECDKPLRWFVLGFSGRYILILPFTIYKLHRMGQGHPVKIVDALLTVLYAGTVAFWIVGQVWYFNSKQCDNTLRVYSLVLIVLMYVVLFLRCVLVVGLFICFAFIFVVFTVFGSRDEGATARLIDSLPKRSFQGEKDRRQPDSDGNKPCCAICQEDFELDDELRCLPCNPTHEFHTRCAEKWLKIKATCPVCRAPITRPNPANAADPAAQPADGEAAAAAAPRPAENMV